MTSVSGAGRARPTIYNGIRMRSRLEARVAAWLDSLGVIWEYEPVAFASPDGQYLPDFELFANDPGPLSRRAFLEVKGALDYEDARLLMRRMESVIGPSDPRAFLIIADAETLEAGIVHAYNYPRLLAWASVFAFPFLVEAKIVPMPLSWRLPAWDA